MINCFLVFLLYSDGDLQQFKAVCKVMLLNSLVSELPEATVTQIVEATGQFLLVAVYFANTTRLMLCA